MLLVAGGIFIHNFDFIHHFSSQYNLWLLNDFVVGLLAGIVALIFVEPILFLIKRIKNGK